MKIKSIVIEFELEGEHEQGHATIIKYEKDMWHMNGPVFSRISKALHEIRRLLVGHRA